MDLGIINAEREIFEIYDLVQIKKNYIDIYNSYEKYSKIMLDFIKSKDILYFKMLFSLIKEKIKNNTNKDELQKELGEYINNPIINNIIDIIFKNNYQNYIPKPSPIPEPEQETSDFTWRTNQDDAIKETIKQNFVSGVHAQVMGSGKSYIILHTIDRHNDKYKTKKMYIITCFRQEILREMFFDKNNSIDKKKSDFLKKNKIINLDDYNIIDRLNIKKKNLTINNYDENKPSILIINNDYFKSLDENNIIDYNDVNFVILDECHSVSADKFHELLYKIKFNFKKHIIGFSATPLRKNADENLKNIFSKTTDKNEKNKNLNLISCYDFINAIKDDIILPPFYVLCEIKESFNGKIGKENKEILKKILKKSAKKYNLPYNKIIGWCKNIENMKEHYENLKEKFNIYCSSCEDNNLEKEGFNTNLKKFYEEEKNSMMICVNKCKEGSDIKNLDCAIYLDNVQNRSLLVSLQTMGRVLRKDDENKKKFGLIIDTYIDDGKTQIEILSAQKILYYYKQIFALCDDSEFYEKKLEDMKKLCDDLEYDEENKIVIVKIDNNENHNIKFKFKSVEFCFEKLKKEMRKIVFGDDKKQIDFVNSQIEYCDVNEEYIYNLKYRSILIKIYEIIGNAEIILNNTNLNIKREKYEEKGFIYNDKIKLSIQGADSNITLTEIIKQCIANKINLNLQTILKSNEEINIIIKDSNCLIITDTYCCNYNDIIIKYIK